MAIPTTYAELQTSIATLDHRTGDTSYTDNVTTFIGLCEADMQVRCKLLEFESTSTVTITSGSGTLPTGYVGVRSAYWDSSPDYPLIYITPDKYDGLRGNDSGDAYYYTISGATIRTTPMGSGSLVITGPVRFTALSNSNTSNALLSNFPDAYLYGSLHQAALFRQDDAAAQKWLALFDRAIDRINKNNEDRKFAGVLAVRAR